jgi:hypothetical protein
MPVASYLETGPTPHVRLTTSASEHTRYIRMAATVAPYINNGVAAAPTLGWKSNEISASARLFTPIYGKFKAFIPNR